MPCGQGLSESILGQSPVIGRPGWTLRTGYLCRVRPLRRRLRSNPYKGLDVYTGGQCRRDIIPILSPSLRRKFRPQKLGFHHKTPCLSLIPFLPPKGGSHSLRKYHHWILLVSTILTTPHMSGSVHRRRRYGSCRFFLFTHSIPPPNTADLRQFFESRDVPHIAG